MTHDHDRRLIEDSLPLEAISDHSAREKQGLRIGQLSGLHIWWARRPLAAMRAAIFASLVPAPARENERAQLHRLLGGSDSPESGRWKGGIADWYSVANGADQHIDQARELIRKNASDGTPKILDLFMGGGSTGLEALRLGCRAYGVELNPVAHLVELAALIYPQKFGQPITRSEYEARRSSLPPVEVGNSSQLDMGWNADELVNPLAEDVYRWGVWVMQEVQKEIGSLHADPEGRTIIGYVWSRTATCPNPDCGTEMPMVRHWWLVKKSHRKVAIRPVVDAVQNRISFEIAEDDDIDFDPSDGTMRRGSIRCPVCGQSPKRSYLKHEGQRGNLGAVLMAVVFDTGERGKGYRAATDFDYQRFEEARTRLEAKLRVDPGALPNEAIPSHSSRAIFVHLYGLTTWGDLFNARQALTTITFVEQIRRMYTVAVKRGADPEYARAVATLIALSLDRLIDYNSTLCTWHSTLEAVAHTFGRQALPMVWDYSEINPFSGSIADWVSGLQRTAAIVEHCTNAADSPANLYLGTASRLPYETSSFDAVITDPPYYDAVPYADLSDFFYVWLKRSIGHLYPEIFVTPTAPKRAEIIQEPGRHKTDVEAKQFYEEQMTLAFQEVHRVLCDTGIFVVVFAHKSTAAWETLLNSLLDAGLIVTASWPLHTETSTRLRAHGSAALASSIFIVCRKRVAEEEGFFDDVRSQIRKRIDERLAFFWEQGIRGADFFISAIGPAVEVFGRYSSVRKLTGETVGVEELLDIVQEAVADYALGRILNGRYRMGAVDGPTRFYVMYRWSYGKEKIPFDDARRLAQALGTEVDNLIHRLGVLKQSGENVELLGPMKRSDQDRLGEPGRDGMAAPIIDVLHRALLLWRAGDRRELAEFLAAHAAGREDSLQAVAQALINVLPDGDREKQLLEGYLAGRDSLPDVPRQDRLF